MPALQPGLEQVLPSMPDGPRRAKQAGLRIFTNAAVSGRASLHHLCRNAVAVLRGIAMANVCRGQWASLCTGPLS